MQVFTQSDKFKSLNVGMVLDEGLPSATDKITVFVAEKSPYCKKTKRIFNTDVLYLYD